MVSFTTVFLLSSNAFLARILDKDNAENCGPVGSAFLGISGVGVGATASFWGIAAVGTAIGGVLDCSTIE